jgi:hypothetical protein
MLCSFGGGQDRRLLGVKLQWTMPRMRWRWKAMGFLSTAFREQLQAALGVAVRKYGLLRIR